MAGVLRACFHLSALHYCHFPTRGCSFTERDIKNVYKYFENVSSASVLLSPPPVSLGTFWLKCGSTSS